VADRAIAPFTADFPISLDWKRLQAGFLGGGEHGRAARATAKIMEKFSLCGIFNQHILST
jgi:hypothetical protein